MNFALFKRNATMKSQRISLSRPRRRTLLRRARKCKDANERTRYMIVLHSAQGKPVRVIAGGLGCCLSTVIRTRRRWREHGEAGLIDRREDNAPAAKADGDYVRTLRWVLSFPAPDHGHRRPTWTLKLLVETMADYTGVRLSVSRMSRLLRALGVRRGRPKPTVGCPWPRRRKDRRIKEIRDLIDRLPDDEAAVWEDEVDLELNPRIGPDWMPPNRQRRVVTPGRNAKAYLAGAMDAKTDRLVWVKGQKKNSVLFLDLLEKLLSVYRDRKVIHVVLDNYTIHSSRQTRLWLAERGGRIRLHFLPPYCPDDNRIERCVWREMHANVTCNHQCEDLEELIAEAAAYLKTRNRRRRAA